MISGPGHHSRSGNAGAVPADGSEINTSEMIMVKQQGEPGIEIIRVPVVLDEPAETICRPPKLNRIGELKLEIVL